MMKSKKDKVPIICAFFFIVGLITGIAVGSILFPTIETRYVSLDFHGVFFSPDGGCKDAVISWINKANSTIHILIYSFTLDDVSNALIEATDRGVDVKIVFDSSQISQYSEYDRLNDAGIDVKKDTNSALMHNKVMIVDEKIILTGSFNWSQNAEERNNENLIVIESVEVSSIFEEEFEKIWIVSE